MNELRDSVSYHIITVYNLRSSFAVHGHPNIPYTLHVSYWQIIQIKVGYKPFCNRNHPQESSEIMKLIIIWREMFPLSLTSI